MNHDAIKFLPLTAVQETESEGTEARNSGDRESQLHRQMQRPGSYNGRFSWDATTPSSTQMLACINDWKDEEKATYLPASLKGPALTVLTVLNNIPPESYDALVSALETCFGSAVRQSCIECVSTQG